jgi:cellulose synthase/poly-beta-1,6-N-acetylglucosamine synthase-like glycosyltransferase
VRITVGIPAYNEALNVEALLRAMISQKLQNGLSLFQIIVVSDGSTDVTPIIVSRFMKEDARVELFQTSTRLGKPAAINEILRQAHGDVIVLIDADTMPVGTAFLSEVVRPFQSNSHVGVTAAVGIAMPYESLVGRAAVFSSKVSRQLIPSKPYFAFNVAIAISAEASKVLKLPSWIVGDDAYLFLKAQRLGLKVTVSQKAQILYREPQTFCDFVLQRRKYDINVAQLRQLFGDSVEEQIGVPRRFWNLFLREMLRDPVGGTVWFLLRGFLRLQRPTNSKEATAGLAVSTKRAFN